MHLAGEEQGPASPTELDERARKREAIGLSAQRPTAKRSVAMPPEQNTSTGPSWIGAILLVSIAVATGWMAWRSVQGVPAPAFLQTAVPAQPLIRDDFLTPQLPLAQEIVDEQWSLGFVGDLYRIQVVKPGSLAWTTLGQLNLGAYRVNAPLRLVGNPGEGDAFSFGGLLARFQNDENFYLMVVDGQGNYAVQVQNEGVWRVIQPWTGHDALERLGEANLLGLEDDGARLRFYANEELLYEVADPKLPAGDIGLVAGTRSQGSAEGTFDWVEIHGIPLVRD